MSKSYKLPSQFVTMCRMIVILSKPATDEDIKQASQHYPNYIKITIDMEKETVALGGEYHFDAEQQLLKLGSKQADIWGGGLELTSKCLETYAMINVRAKINPSQDICDSSIKKHFLEIAYKFLSNYAAKPQILC